MKFSVKELGLIALFSISLFVANSQNGGYSKGDNLLNIGIGLNSNYDGGLPLGASFETGLFDDISVGAGVDYLSNKYNFGSGNTYKFTSLYFAARASYHFNNLLKISSDKVDIYAGLALGYRSFKWKNKSFNDVLGDSYGSGVFLGGYLGGKYYFSDNIGGFAELGATGSSNARLGIAFKF